MYSYFLSNIYAVSHYKKMYFFSFAMILFNIFLQLSIIQVFLVKNFLNIDFDIIIYILLSAFISCSVSIYRVPNFSTKIVNGDYAIYGIRPFGYTTQFFYEDFTMSLTFGLIYCCIPIATSFFYNVDLLNVFSFFVSYVLGVVLASEIIILVYSLTIITQKNSAVKALFGMVSSLLSGTLIPLNFFPKNYINFIQYLPFASIVNTPIQIFFDFSKNLKLLCVQFIWIVLFFIINYFFTEKILKIQRHIGG